MATNASFAAFVLEQIALPRRVDVRRMFGEYAVYLDGKVVAIQQFKLAYTATFRKHLRTAEMSADEERWAITSGRVGYAARGITFSIIGTALAIAGLRADPSEAKGLGEAL